METTEQLGEALSAYVDMRQTIEAGPLTSWTTAHDPAVDCALAKLVLPAVYTGALDAADCSIGIRQRHDGPGGEPFLGTLAKPDLKALRAMATPAPFGRGSQRVTDRAVRDALQVPADALAFGVSDIEKKLLRACHLEHHDRLRLRLVLYKLHLYEAGGHFAEHKDTPHGKNHVMTGILLLGAPFEGGELVLAGGGASVTQAEDEGALRVAAWYTDVPHEVRRVTSGTRAVLQFDIFADALADKAGDAEDEEKDDEEEDPGDQLTYNVEPEGLVRAGYWKDAISGEPFAGRASGLAEALRGAWTRRPEPAALLLRHQYLTEQLAPGALKGADRALWEALAGAADMELALEYLLLQRRTPGSRDLRGEPEYAPEWGPMRRGTGWSVADGVRLYLGPYVLHERATELASQLAAESTGNEPMDGHEAYLFAALVARRVGEPAKKRKRT